MHVKALAIKFTDVILKNTLGTEEESSFEEKLEFFKQNVNNYSHLVNNGNKTIDVVIWYNIGFQHNDIDNYIQPLFHSGNKEYGFIDSNNKFLNRKEAYLLAVKSEQIAKDYKNQSSYTLFSYMLVPYDQR